MIFGWLAYGVTDRWVLVDPVFPWPALHNGRNAIRLWADIQGRQRTLNHTPGPRRCPWPCKTAVKETGDAELRIWPCEPYGKPRAWTRRDHVWREPLATLAEIVATDIGCPVVLIWIGSDGEIERAVSPPGLQGRGFQCWGKGEHEPRSAPLANVHPLKLKLKSQDINIMTQGDDAWH